MTAKPKVLLVGCGKMGGALLRRWQEQALYSDIRIIEPHALEWLEDKRVPALAQLPPDFTPEVIVMAVKPQVLPEMIGDYKSYSDKGALLLSIAAGKPVGFFEENLGATAAIVRAMPNTPASIGEGITVAFANSHVTAAQKAEASALLESVGEALWVAEEQLLNPVTALSGSGPAYVFLLIEVLAKAGQSIGLDAALAEKLARQTVIGSAALAKASPETPAAKLRENVTSPNGTTAAALAVLMADPGLQALMTKALEAATKRAEELSR